MTDKAHIEKLIADLRALADRQQQREVFLIWSNQHGAWWRPNERGYASVLEEAGIYPRADAERIVRSATCDGQLVHERTCPVTGRRYQCVDEVAVPAWQWPGRISGFARESAVPVVARDAVDDGGALEDAAAAAGWDPQPWEMPEADRG